MFDMRHCPHQAMAVAHLVLRNLVDKDVEDLPRPVDPHPNSLTP